MMTTTTRRAAHKEAVEVLLPENRNPPVPLPLTNPNPKEKKKTFPI